MVIYNERILLVDPEPQIQKLLTNRFTELGYKITLATDGNKALEIFEKEPLDLVILDPMLPGIDGFTLCRKMRECSELPIIILSGCFDISDRVMGLEAGADDYLTKPFSLKELEARVRSLLRRTNDSLSQKRIGIIKIDQLYIDLQKRVVLNNNSKIKLTDIEHRLLELLINQSGKYLSRETILDNVWGYTPERAIDTRIVDVHISRLRSKIELNPKNPDLIVTIRGIGYMFQHY